ncbi:MAG: hypothetical protein EP329_21800 [Deltaproteobacteria bacterium]|nr:MAG: hypothetical protein EP329_21800 [Deltaproteobacteria bacterium]
MRPATLPLRAAGLAACGLAFASLVGCTDGARIAGEPDSAPIEDTVEVDSTSVDTWTPAPATCATDADCDDSRLCTVDRCDLTAVSPHCVWEIVPDTCFINNVCRVPGEARPEDPCRQCDPTQDASGWTVVADGGSCDDHDLCTDGSRCFGGACIGDAVVSCDDGEACTVDSCTAALGCVHEHLNGDVCDDGLRCTGEDRCERGTCVGAPESCDDGNPCTVDVCTEDGGCQHLPAEVACEDGDPCTVGDSCRDGVCVSGGPNACDDENFCTVDTCHAVVGCVHLPTSSPCCIGAVEACDDGNPCTADLCDPLTGECATEPAEGPCDDHNACTVDDVCVDAVCGGRVRDCSDGDPCTEDSCSPNAGCGYSPLTGPACDDGLACSVGDACLDGACVADTSACLCTPVLSDDGAKLVTLAIGDGGYVGEGLDLDDDPSTCAPSATCDSGINNSLGIIASFANDSIADAVAGGDLSLIAMFSPRGADPDQITLSMFAAELSPTTPDCDPQTGTCDWLVKRDLLDPETCVPLVTMPGTIDGNVLTAIGDAALPFEMRLSADAVIEITIGSLRVVGTVTRSGGRITGMQGILAGAVPKEQLLVGIGLLPDDSLPPPLDKPTVLGLVDALVTNDIDTTGNGSEDSASIGIKFTAIDGHIVGAAD